MIFCHYLRRLIFSIPILCLEITQSFFKIIMKSKSIDKEIMYLESIQLLFIFYKLHRECLSFFSNKADRNTFFEDTNFWEDHFNFPIHFINGIELNEKPTEKLLSFSFGKLRLFIFNNMCLDNFHLIKYNFLT